MCSPGIFENIKSEKSNYEKAKNIMAFDDSYDPYSGYAPQSPGAYGSSGEWDIYDEQAQEYQINEANEQYLRDTEAYIKNRQDEEERQRRAGQQHRSKQKKSRRKNSLEIDFRDDRDFYEGSAFSEDW